MSCSTCIWTSKAKKAPQTLIYFFPWVSESEKHTNEFYMNTCCRKTWEDTFISCDLRSRWVPAMFLMFPFFGALKLCLCCCFPPFLFLPVFYWCYPSTLFYSLLFPSSPRHPALRSEFILGPHQSHRRAGAAPLHPWRPRSFLLLSPLHRPVRLQTPLSCHHLFAFFSLYMLRSRLLLSAPLSHVSDAASLGLKL